MLYYILFSDTAINYHMLGTEMWSGLVSEGMQLDISVFSEGLYFVRFGNDVANFIVKR